MFRNHSKWLVIVTLIYAMLISCGGLASTKQPTQQLPPSIQVRALYSGADVNTVLNSVAIPLKESIFQHVEDMDHMSYTASSDGSLVMTVYFKPGTNPDAAALNISNLAAVITSQLPAQMAGPGITVSRQHGPIVMAIDLYAEKDGPYDDTFLAKYAATNIIPDLQRTPGVSQVVTADHNKDSLTRICLNKQQMSTFNLTLQEVLAAIPAKQLEAVTGVLFKDGKQPFDYIIKCKSEHHQPVTYGDMKIRTNADTVLRLKDVAAKMEFGPYTHGNFTRIRGDQPGVSMIVMQQTDSNNEGIQAAIKKLMETVSKNLPTGIKYSILYNPKDSLYISME